MSEHILLVVDRSGNWRKGIKIENNPHKPTFSNCSFLRMWANTYEDGMTSVAI